MLARRSTVQSRPGSSWMASTTRSRKGSFDTEGQPAGAQPFAAHARMTLSSTVWAIMRQITGSPWRTGHDGGPAGPILPASAAAAGSRASKDMTVIGSGRSAVSWVALAENSRSTTTRSASASASRAIVARPNVRNASPETRAAFSGRSSTATSCAARSTSSRHPVVRGGCPLSAPLTMYTRVADPEGIGSRSPAVRATRLAKPTRSSTESSTCPSAAESTVTMPSATPGES